MPFLKSLPETAYLADLFQAFPKSVAPMMAYTNEILRGEGALSIAEREMIATYTSALNACTFCDGSQKALCAAFWF